MTKTNPRRRPASAATVRKAWDDGVHEGVRNASAIFLTVIVDKYGMADRVIDVWEDICKLSEEISEGRITFADLRHVLKNEYKIEV